ncbi:hypothetical protein GAYE_HPESCF16G0260 [Galdieria yellowstonensis]|uniref:Uncharacterized protein n=1 Tax=Galdieria yellowstonensis TaxID=3028027 RepID=A0AAV9I5Y0_9RHOD|nr:hypothetical protein GAYE_HPESCF16G0260 [Galdieria yellowstonensis]
MDAASSRLKRACGIHMKWEQVFDPVTMKIDRKYANVWLEDLPDLSVECSVTEVSELLGEKIKVGSEEFSTRDSSLVDVASLLRPKRLAKNFPLNSSGSRISRVFLRQDIINLWNALVDEENTEDLKVIYAASGLGKSIYLYLIAVFARHFGIPVQYIGNTGDLLREKVDDNLVACNYVENTGAMLRKKFDYKLVARKYAAMLLFMNSGTLDSLKLFYPLDPDYEHLRGLPMKHVIFYAHERGDLVLCCELRRNFMLMKPRNLLIIDEHNDLWQKFGSDTKTWLPFFKFYAEPVGHATWYCKFVIATSQLHEFNLPSGYELSIQYVEPLSLEEFAIWENLSDYPRNLKDKKNEVIDLTGLVPRMIGTLVNLAKTSSDLSFEDLFLKFRHTIFLAMQQKHDEYVDALDKRKKTKFMQMLHKLFVDRETPKIRVCDAAYQDRGLLIALNDCSLQFYNSIARDILYSAFSEFEFTENRINELSRKYKKSRKSCDSSGEYS